MATGKPLTFSRRQASLLLGIGARQFDEAVRPRLKKGAISGAGAKLRFDGPAVVAAWLEHKLPRGSASELAEPGMDGPESPALERFRTYRAEQEAIKLDLMRRDSIPRKELEGGLAIGAIVLRRAAEDLQRLFGKEAWEIFNSAIEDMEAAWTRALTEAARDELGLPPLDAAPEGPSDNRDE